MGPPTLGYATAVPEYPSAVRDPFLMRLCIMIAEHLSQAAIKPAIILLDLDLSH
jgi:hypothetical protein